MFSYIYIYLGIAEPISMFVHICENVIYIYICENMYIGIIRESVL